MNSKHVRENTFMMSTWKKDRGGLKIYPMSSDSFAFKQKINCSSFWMEGVGGVVIFCGHCTCMAPKWFKITINSIIRDSTFFFNIKPQARYIFTEWRTTPSPSTFHHSTLY